MVFSGEIERECEGVVSWRLHGIWLIQFCVKTKERELRVGAGDAGIGLCLGEEQGKRI